MIIAGCNLLKSMNGFTARDGETTSTLSIENPDWKKVVLTNTTTSKQVSGTWIRHAYEFDLTPGHNYSVE